MVIRGQELVEWGGDMVMKVPREVLGKGPEPKKSPNFPNIRTFLFSIRCPYCSVIYKYWLKNRVFYGQKSPEARSLRNIDNTRKPIRELPGGGDWLLSFMVRWSGD